MKKFLMSWVVVPYLCFSVVALGVGLGSSKYDRYEHGLHPSRLSVILPAYALGCWLVEDSK